MEATTTMFAQFTDDQRDLLNDATSRISSARIALQNLEGDYYDTAIGAILEQVIGMLYDANEQLDR